MLKNSGDTLVIVRRHQESVYAIVNLLDKPIQVAGDNNRAGMFCP